MSCPSDEVLAAWTAGALAGAERDALEDHAAGCASCRSLAVAMAGVVPGGSGGFGAEGATIGRYRILGAAGHGAMGVVLRGHDPVLDREVAIKMVKSTDANAETRARMLTEAQTLARIDHPNVVRVHDAGSVGDEVFVAMAFVTGPTLAQWLADASPDAAARVRIVRTVGAGIAAVHAVGLVHRDIKPDNIIVHDGDGVLVDLGLARAAGGALGSGVAGTAHYIAPEVRAGTRATPASDQFAWCVVVDETLRAAALAPPQRAALECVLARGRADDPAARYATLDDAIAAVVEATADPPPPSSPPPPRRARWPIAAALAVVLGGAAAIVIATRDTPDACARAIPTSWALQRPAIAARLAAAGADAHRVLAELDRRATRYAALGSETCHAASAASADERTRALREQLCLDQAWTGTEHIFPGLAASEDRVVRAAVDDLIVVPPLDRCTNAVIPAVPAPPAAAIAHEAGEVEAALRAIRLDPDRDPAHLLARLRALEPRVVALDYAPMLEVLHTDLAGALRGTGDGSGSLRELQQVVAIGETSGDDDARTRALINLLRQAFDAGSHDTVALQSQAEAAAARLDNPAITAQLDMSVALARFTRGDATTALAKMLDAQRLLESVAIDAHAQLVGVAQNLGGIQQATGDLVAAQATFDHGYALARQRYGDAALDTLEIRGARATNLMYTHRIADARPELVAVAAQLQAAVGDAPPVAQARGYVCEADLEVEDLVASHASCDAALAEAEHVFGKTHPQLAWTLALVGRQRLAEHAPAAAIEPLERALAVSADHAITPADQPIAQAYLALALLGAHRDPARAKQLATTALAGLRAVPETSDVQAKLAAAFP